MRVPLIPIHEPVPFFDSNEPSSTAPEAPCTVAVPTIKRDVVSQGCDITLILLTVVINNSLLEAIEKIITALFRTYPS